LREQDFTNRRDQRNVSGERYNATGANERVIGTLSMSVSVAAVDIIGEPSRNAKKGLAHMRW
jgi:hypothetical protein